MKNWTKFLKKNKLTIFLFHGVINESKYEVRNYNKKHILASAFSQFLKSVNSIGTPVSMDEVLQFTSGKAIPDYSFAITFDDGFKNNFEVAAPILEKFQIPATFYVTTGFVEHNLMSWIDRIEIAFEKVESFDFNLPYFNHEFVSTKKGKIELLERIRENVKKNPNINVSKFADKVQKELRFPITNSSNEPLDEKMNWEDVYQLSKNPLFTIGGHTHTHRIMSFLDEKELEKEVSLSLRLIHKHTGIKVSHYSYPEGLKHCFNENVVNMLKKYDILCSPTAIHGWNNSGADSFELKRVFVN